MKADSAAPMRLGQMLKADLLANAGRSGFVGTLSALLYDPSSSAVFFYRLAAWLYQRGLRRCAKLLWRVNVIMSGCHLHLEARIGPGLKLPHPVGITVGSGAQVGTGVTLYQHVTIGAGFRDGAYPVIGDGCILFPNAVVAGGILIGARSVIGASAVVIADVPAGAVVAGNPARVIRTASDSGSFVRD